MPLRADWSWILDRTDAATALAGAFYRFLDHKVLVGIFDEPMANCDVQTRARFYEAISKAPEFCRKTVIMSLHDPLYFAVAYHAVARRRSMSALSKASISFGRRARLRLFLL